MTIPVRVRFAKTPTQLDATGFSLDGEYGKYDLHMVDQHNYWAYIDTYPDTDMSLMSRNGTLFFRADDITDEVGGGIRCGTVKWRKFQGSLSIFFCGEGSKNLREDGEAYRGLPFYHLVNFPSIKSIMSAEATAKTYTDFLNVATDKMDVAYFSFLDDKFSTEDAALLKQCYTGLKDRLAQVVPQGGCLVIQ